ncbi:unnamed protein product [Phaedon cochleariae]|uniref:Uncharacterized protein n=1 Tax=Phaedon cochleariae TaxID=80249 RepID=A0A9N9S7F4_PHACE|nr:unnamed protein product [Phaedon cochleariae]CAG9812952.1 unnamed protein product [Phaedon cochleariae]
MYKSSVYIILFFIAVEFSSAYLKLEELGEKLSKLAPVLHNTCVKKTGIPEATISSMREGNFKEEDKSKEYVTCIWLESQIIKPDGTLNRDRMMELCPPQIKETGPKIVLGCWEKVEEVTPLEKRVYELQKCFYKSDPENYIMI